MRRALLGAKAICSEEFPPANMFPFCLSGNRGGREGEKAGRKGANGAKTRLDRFRLLGSQSRDCVFTLRSLRRDNSSREGYFDLTLEPRPKGISHVCFLVHV